MSCPSCGVNKALQGIKKGVLMFRPCADCKVVYKRRSPATRSMMAGSTLGSLMSEVRDDPTNWVAKWGGSFNGI